MNTTFTTVTWAVTAGVAAYAAWSVIRALRADSRRLAALRRELPKLGFAELDRTDPELNKRLLQIYPLASKHRTVDRAWKLEEPGCCLYVVDFWGAPGVGDGDRTSSLTEGCVLLASPSLRLPRFRVLPRIDLPSALPALARRWREYVDSRLGGPVELDNVPEEFEQRYTVTAEDPAATREFLKTQLLRELGQARHRIIEAADDMFTYLRREPEFPGHRTKPPEIATLVAEARSVCRLFQGANTE